MLGYLRYRVVDPNTGAVVVNELPHPHQSEWQVRAYQRGAPTSSMVGSFHIPLHPAGSEAYQAALYDYSQLAYGQKVEGYLGDVLSGPPRYTGLIREINKSLAGAVEIVGADTLDWLQQSITFQGDRWTGKSGDVIVKKYLDDIEVFGDFLPGTTGGSFLPGGTQNPAGRYTTTTDPNMGGISAATATGATNIWAFGANGNITNANFEGRIDLFGSLTSTSTDTSNAGDLGLIYASDSGGNNFFTCEVKLRYSGTAGLYNVDVAIWQDAAGVFTQKAVIQNVFTNVPVPFPIQLTVWSVNQLGVTPPIVTASLNGTDLSDRLSFQMTSMAGRVGLISSVGSGSFQAWADLVTVRKRDDTSPRFAQGTIASGSGKAGPLRFTGQTHLDMLGIAATQEGWLLRKSGGAGARADTIDANVNPGSDLSKTVVFEQDVNLSDLQLVANAETYATDVRLAGPPGINTGGSVEWTQPLATGSIVLEDTVPSMAPKDFFGGHFAAAAIQASKSNPGQAKVAIVIRDADTADKWRELDTVTIHAPRIGLDNVKAVVVGYSFKEGAGTQEVLLDSYAFQSAQYAASRLGGSVKLMAGQFQSR